MQVTLIFPPSWIPSQPFLSLPSLQGFLKKEGVANVTIRDLNIETMDILLSSEKVKETLAKLSMSKRPRKSRLPRFAPTKFCMSFLYLFRRKQDVHCFYIQISNSNISYTFFP